jgi:hypothetical protein
MLLAPPPRSPCVDALKKGLLGFLGSRVSALQLLTTFSAVLPVIVGWHMWGHNCRHIMPVCYVPNGTTRGSTQKVLSSCIRSLEMCNLEIRHAPHASCVSISTLYQWWKCAHRSRTHPRLTILSAFVCKWLKRQGSEILGCMQMWNSLHGPKPSAMPCMCAQHSSQNTSACRQKNGYIKSHICCHLSSTAPCIPYQNCL